MSGVDHFLIAESHFSAGQFLAAEVAHFYTVPITRRLGASRLLRDHG